MRGAARGSRPRRPGTLRPAAALAGLLGAAFAGGGYWDDSGAARTPWGRGLEAALGLARPAAVTAGHETAGAERGGAGSGDTKSVPPLPLGGVRAPTGAAGRAGGLHGSGDDEGGLPTDDPAAPAPVPALPLIPPPAPAQAEAGAAPDVRALVARLGDDDPRVRTAAHAALRRRGEAARAALAEGAASDDPEVRWRCRELLARLGR